MNEPRRLKDSAGSSQRLLDSASLDRAGAASRERMSALMSTSGAFSRSSPTPAARPGVLRTFTTWAAIGAAASVALAYAGSRLLGSNADGAEALAHPELTPPPSMSTPSDIEAEPLGLREPWVAALPLDSAPEGERQSVEQARSALARGDLTAALVATNAYLQTRPDGALRAQAEVLRVQALWLQGKRSDAIALSEAFRQQHPHHPLGRQLPGAAAPPHNP